MESLSGTLRDGEKNPSIFYAEETMRECERGEEDEKKPANGGRKAGRK